MKKKTWLWFIMMGFLLTALPGNRSIYAQEDSKSENTRPAYSQPEKREIQEDDIVLVDNEEMLFLIEGTNNNEENERNQYYPLYLDNRGDETLCVFITGMQVNGRNQKLGFYSPYIMLEPGQRLEERKIGLIRFTREGEEMALNFSVSSLEEYNSYVEKVGQKAWRDMVLNEKVKNVLPFKTFWSDEVILELQDGKLVRKEMTQKQEMLADTFYGQTWLDNLSSEQSDLTGGVYTDLENGVRIWIPDNWYLTAEEKEIKNSYSADYSTLESSEETGESNWKLYNSDFTHLLRIRKLDIKTMLGNLAVAAYAVTEEQLFTELERRAEEARRIRINGHKALLMTEEGYDDTYDTFIVWMSKNKSVFVFTINGQEDEWTDDERILALPREEEDVYMQTLQKVLNSIEISGFFGGKGTGKPETQAADDAEKPETQAADDAERPDGAEKPKASGSDEKDNVLTALCVRTFSYNVDYAGTSSFYENGQLKESLQQFFFNDNKSGTSLLLQYDEYGNPLLNKNMTIKNGEEEVSADMSWVYEYDEEGRILSSIRTDHLEGTELARTYEYEFDQVGNPVCRTALGEGGKQAELDRMEYDEAGRLIRITSEAPDGTIYSDTEYEYNEQGQMIRRIRNDSEALKNGEKKAWLITSYEYDSLGRRKMEYNSSGQGGMSCQFYIYETNGQ